jgi:hypothetical protein
MLQKGMPTMTFQIPSRRAILLSGFALMVAAAPAVGVVVVTASSPATPLAECPAGFVMEPTSGSCVMGEAPDTPSAIPGNPALPEVDGIPCTGANTGECIGLQESEGGAPAPIP